MSGDSDNGAVLDRTHRLGRFPCQTLARREERNARAQVEALWAYPVLVDDEGLLQDQLEPLQSRWNRGFKSREDCSPGIPLVRLASILFLLTLSSNLSGSRYAGTGQCLPAYLTQTCQYPDSH